jgi:hypothetical protein
MMIRVAAANRRSRGRPSPSVAVTDTNDAVPEPTGKSHFSRVLVVVGVTAGKPLMWHIADGDHVRRRRCAVEK